MAGSPPLSPELWNTIPPAAQAALLVVFESYKTQLARLEARIAELEAKIGKDSTNSSKPPSTDHPHAKPVPNKPKSKRPIGGQPGHPKHERALIPSEECRTVIPCLPTACRRCGEALAGTDSQPLRHQVWELPEIKPVVTEYQPAAAVARPAAPCPMAFRPGKPVRD
jgi:transposase